MPIESVKMHKSLEKQEIIKQRFINWRKYTKLNENREEKV